MWSNRRRCCSATLLPHSGQRFEYKWRIFGRLDRRVSCPADARPPLRACVPSLTALGATTGGGTSTTPVGRSLLGAGGGIARTRRSTSARIALGGGIGDFSFGGLGTRVPADCDSCSFEARVFSLEWNDSGLRPGKPGFLSSAVGRWRFIDSS